LGPVLCGRVVVVLVVGNCAGSRRRNRRRMGLWRFGGVRMRLAYCRGKTWWFDVSAGGLVDCGKDLESWCSCRCLRASWMRVRGGECELWVGNGLVCGGWV